ncbi:MAG: glycine-rich protein [Candidatus Cybelea sp.]
MKSWRFRYALTVLTLSTLPAGCGGSQPPIAAPSDNISQTARKHKVFQYTGGEQTFIVPAKVTKTRVVALGAGGAAGYGTGTGYTYVPGGLVRATIPVTPGETLYVFVGGEGSFYSAGYNGGGSGGASAGSSPYIPGYGGGGASDIRQGGDALNDRVIVAGGGAGSTYGGGSGGVGGGKIGESGGSSGSGSYASVGGGGGTQKSGGPGGAGPVGSCPGGAGASGELGQGGDGGGSCFSDEPGGGGGGGGYYGGGGGSGGCYSPPSCSGAGAPSRLRRRWRRWFVLRRDARYARKEPAGFGLSRQRPGHHLLVVREQ